MLLENLSLYNYPEIVSLLLCLRSKHLPRLQFLVSDDQWSCSSVRALIEAHSKVSGIIHKRHLLRCCVLDNKVKKLNFLYNCKTFYKILFAFQKGKDQTEYTKWKSAKYWPKNLKWFIYGWSLIWGSSIIGWCLWQADMSKGWYKWIQ